MDHKTISPKVAFIIISWNNQEILGECFDSIKSQTYNDHVTVMVDNASADESVAFTNAEYPWVDVYESGENLAFARGNNAGVEYALKKYPHLQYFVLLNSDARLRTDWLETVLTFASKKPRGALFQTVTLDYYNHSIIDSTHIYISRNGSGTQGNWRKPYIDTVGPKLVFGANAAAVLVSKRFLDAQPFPTMFDENMFMYLEDVDLSARALVMGWDNYLVPGSCAYHMGSVSSNKKPGFSLFMTYRNNLALLLKNIPFKLFLRMLPSLIRSDYHTIRHLRRIDQGGSVKHLVKGRIVGLLRLPYFIPSIITMHKYRKTVSTERMWSLMDKGE